eukprot:6816026-Prymnesium_polylepis.1
MGGHSVQMASLKLKYQYASQTCAARVSQSPQESIGSAPARQWHRSVCAHIERFAHLTQRACMTVLAPAESSFEHKDSYTRTAGCIPHSHAFALSDVIGEHIFAPVTRYYKKGTQRSVGHVAQSTKQTCVAGAAL